MQHPIPPTPTTISYSFEDSIRKQELADVMETRVLMIGTESPVFLLGPLIKCLVVREGFHTIPALAEHANASVKIALQPVPDLVFQKAKVEKVLSSSQEPKTAVTAI
jgi:hypothetical protein